MSIQISDGNNDIFIGNNGKDPDDDVVTKAVDRTELTEGTDGKDKLTGGSKEDDLIFGRKGKDVIKGANGDDVLIGGTGNDTLTGGYGIDTYVLALDKSVDTITDFSSKDRIFIDKEAFDATSTDQFTYDDDTGKLFFDAEVKGTDPVHIATLPEDLGSKFDVEKDIIFDEVGIINSIDALTSDSFDIEIDGETIVEDFFTAIEI